MPAYRLTKAAADDLTAIFREGLAEYGLAQADAYHAHSAAAFEFLAEYPRAARLRNEFQPPVRAHPCKSHHIVYDVTGDDLVIILRVRHGREDWQWR